MTEEPVPSSAPTEGRIVSLKGEAHASGHGGTQVSVEPVTMISFRLFDGLALNVPVQSVGDGRIVWKGRVLEREEFKKHLAIVAAVHDLDVSLGDELIYASKYHIDE